MAGKLTPVRVIVVLLVWFLPVLAQRPAMVAAARRGDLAALRSLLADKSDINKPGPNGRTVLHEAALACQLGSAQVLVEAGADRLARDRRGNTPAMLSLRCTDPSVRNSLFHALLTPLPSDQADQKGSFSLLNAVSNGQVSVVSMLLKMGAGVDESDADGYRPLDIACLKGNAPIARLLLDHGAQFKTPSRAGATALHYAAVGGNAEVVEMLIARGSEVDALDRENGDTPLYNAASFGRLQAARSLWRHGADPNRGNARGVTPLQAAADNGHPDIVELLKRAN